MEITEQTYYRWRQKYGGRGNDLLNMDDDHDSSATTAQTDPEVDSLDNAEPDPFQTYADISYGGAGRDVLIMNTGSDRGIDWTGEFNSFIVPFSPFGAFHITRALAPQITEYLYDLSADVGADVRAVASDNSLVPPVPDVQLFVQQKSIDVSLDDPDPVRNFEPYGELGLVRSQDFDWQPQTGAPADPQPGNRNSQTGCRIVCTHLDRSRSFRGLFSRICLRLLWSFRVQVRQT